MPHCKEPTREERALTTAEGASLQRAHTRGEGTTAEGASLQTAHTRGEGTTAEGASLQRPHTRGVSMLCVLLAGTSTQSVDTPHLTHARRAEASLLITANAAMLEAKSEDPSFDSKLDPYGFFLSLSYIKLFLPTQSLHNL